MESNAIFKKLSHFYDLFEYFENLSFKNEASHGLILKWMTLWSQEEQINGPNVGTKYLKITVDGH